MAAIRDASNGSKKLGMMLTNYGTNTLPRYAYFNADGPIPDILDD